MAKHDIETQWMGKMKFNAQLGAHTIVMDAPAKVGGEDSGTIPKPLVLAALSGCTGMDIVALLRKAGISPAAFSLRVSGELSKQPPLEYISIHLVYEFEAETSALPKIIEAVTYSQEKYCGVSHMLKRAIPVTWSIVFNGEPVTVVNEAISVTE